MLGSDVAKSAFYIEKHPMARLAGFPKKESDPLHVQRWKENYCSKQCILNVENFHYLPDRRKIGIKSPPD